jgi:hypothetical protein
MRKAAKERPMSTCLSVEADPPRLQAIETMDGLMTKLPADFVESAVSHLGRWWDRVQAAATSEYARGAMRDNLLGHLRRGDLSTVPRAYIETMAYQRHEPAQDALRIYIAEAIDNHYFDELPVGLQEFNRRFLLDPNMSGYGRGNKIIDTWTRDILISGLVGEAMKRWRLKKNQAAAIVAIMLKPRGVKAASKTQVLEIYNNRTTIGARVVEFMMAAIPDDEEPPPES